MTAAAAVKSLHSCLTLCDPRDSSPPGSLVPGILQARTLEWVAISLSNAWKWKVKGKSLRHVWLLATPWTAAYQAPPPMGFSKQEYWSRVALPSPSLPMSHLESPIHVYIQAKSAESCFPFHSVEWKSWKPRKEKFLSKQSVIRKFDPSLLFRNLVFVL